MNPYYEILNIVRRQAAAPLCIAQGEIGVDPLRVAVLDEVLEGVSFMGHINTAALTGGERCLVYLGREEYVVLGVF